MRNFLGTIEAKVWAAAGGGSILSGFLLWLLGYLAFGGALDASKAEHTAALVPPPVALLIVALSAAVAGYSAPHTDRAAAIPEPDSSASSASSASGVLATANAIFPN